MPRVVVAYAENDGQEQPDGARKIKEAAPFGLHLNRRRGSAKLRKDRLCVPVGVGGGDVERRLDEARGQFGQCGSVLLGNLTLKPSKVFPQKGPLAPQFVRAIGHDCPFAGLRLP
jgi:hypothetical protein